MIYVLGILFVILAFLLICSILLQEGKGGGLAAMGGAMTDSVMGAKNPMRRMTVYFFICFIVVVLALNYNINQDNSGSIAPGLTVTPEPTIPAATTEDVKTPADAPATLPAADVPATPATATETAPAAPATAPATPTTTTPAATPEN